MRPYHSKYLFDMDHQNVWTQQNIFNWPQLTNAIIVHKSFIS